VGGPGAAAASNAFTSLSSRWPDQLAEGVESAVGLVRDKAVRPATTLAKALVYGPLAAIIGLTALVLVAIAAVRGLNVIPGFQDWISLCALGGLFTLVGLFLLRRGRSALKTPK
jgi:hypothetical protein